MLFLYHQVIILHAYDDCCYTSHEFGFPRVSAGRVQLMWVSTMHSMQMP